MLFHSPAFLFVFLPVAFLLVRFLPGNRAKNITLGFLGILFYAFGQLNYVPLLLLSVLLNRGAGSLLVRKQDPAARKTVLVVAVAVNLLILCVFKYTDFLLSNVNMLLGTAIPLPRIVLPLGISFFTFQGLSYVIDVYRDPSLGAGTFQEVLLYITFFPRLISGPIVPYHQARPQLAERSTTPEQEWYGLHRFVTGLAKKVLLSSSMAKIADAAFTECASSAARIDSRLAWLGALCYLLQIYFDFSGYSDMAIGLSALFGFRTAENFRLPYAALSIRDFWRRWHISLSSWFRDYLYIPLGGSRKGKTRAALNRLLVFLCTGVWHGANWTFVVWGLGHGLLSSLEGAGILPVDRLQKTLPGRILCRVYTLLSVMLLFVLFRADSVGEAGRFLASMFAFRSREEASLLLTRLLSPAAVVTLLVAVLCAGQLAERLKNALGSSRLNPDSSGTASAGIRVLQIALLMVLFILCLMSISRGGFAPFIYFQF